MNTNTTPTYEVIVGNIGTVYTGTDQHEAMEYFKEYKTQSVTDYGRAGGEEVTLMEDGEPVIEHFGTQHVAAENTVVSRVCTICHIPLPPGLACFPYGEGTSPRCAHCDYGSSIEGDDHLLPTPAPAPSFQNFEEAAAAVWMMNASCRERYECVENLRGSMEVMADMYCIDEGSASFSTSGYELTAFDCADGRRHVRASVSAYTAKTYIQRQVAMEAKLREARDMLNNLLDILEGNSHGEAHS